MPGAHRCRASDEWYYTGMDIVFVVMFKLCFYIVRYDIKGCEVSRWTDPAPVGSQIIVVLKDLNFEGQYINLGKKRAGRVFYLLGTG